MLKVKFQQIKINFVFPWMLRRRRKGLRKNDALELKMNFRIGEYLFESFPQVSKIFLSLSNL